MLCLDQDNAGKQAALRLENVLRGQGHTQIALIVDRDRYARALAIANQPLTGDNDCAHLTQAHRHVALVKDVIARGVARGVNWAGAKDLGALLPQGGQGRARFEQLFAETGA